VNVDHNVVRFRVLPFSPGAVEEGAIRAVAVACSPDREAKEPGGLDAGSNGFRHGPSPARGIVVADVRKASRDAEARSVMSFLAASSVPTPLYATYARE
jgi:hypothetical protein